MTAAVVGPAETLIAPVASKRWTWLDFVLLLVVLAIAVVVRVKWIDPAPSFDELWHLKSTVGRGSLMGGFDENVLYTNPPHVTSTVGAPAFWHVWTGMNGVLHPPLHIMQLRLWRDVFGDSDFVAHSNSIAWSLVAIAFVFDLIRRATDRWCAMLGVLGFVFAPTQIYFAQEIRGYSMLIGLSAIALWLMTRIAIDGPTRGRAIVLALLPVPMLLTHYFAFGAVLAIGIYGVVALKGQRRAFFIALFAGAACYAFAWLPLAVRQLKDLGTGDAFLSVDHVNLFDEATELATAPFRLLIDRSFWRQPQGAGFALLFVLPWLLVRKSRWLLPWVLSLCCAIFILVALDLARSTNHLLYTRYLSAASPAVLPVFIGCVWSVRRSLAYVAAGVLGFMSAIFLFSGAGIAIECDSFGTLASDIEKRIKPGEGIVAYHGKLPLFYGDVFMLTLSHSPTLFPKPIMRITGPISPEIAATLPRHVWLIAGELGQPIEQVIPGARVTDQYSVDLAVTLWHLDLAPAATTQP